METVGPLLAEISSDMGVLWPFLFVFGMLILCGLGFPIPEELPVVLAGLWVGSDDALALGPVRWLILPVCILGVVIGDGFLYGMGRFFGRRLFELRFFQHLFPQEKRARVEKNFSKYGVGVLLFARLLPGIRGPIFITAGMMKLPWRRFLLADGLYAIPGVCLLFFLSWWFRNAFADLVIAFEQKVDHLRPLLFICFIAAIAAYLLYKFYRKPVVEGDPQELPILGPPVARVIEASSKDNIPAAPVTPAESVPSQALMPQPSHNGVNEIKSSLSA